MQLSFTLLKLKVIKLKNKKFDPSIRNYQNKQTKNIGTRLRSFQRRPMQVWQWRRNRKAFRPWRQLRYTLPYKIDRLSKIYQRSNFRLNRIFFTYLSWRLGTTFKPLNFLSKIRRQNKRQSNNKVTSLLLEQNLGNILILNRLVRNQHSFNRSLRYFGVNGRAINSTINLQNSIISNRKGYLLVIGSKLTQESSQLLNVLLQHNTSNSLILKYNPKLQRSLNSYYLLHNK